MTGYSRQTRADARLVETLGELDAALHSDTFVRVRRRIFRQLIESLIYEGLVRPDEQPGGREILFLINGQDEEGRPVTYECAGRRRASFDRIRLSTRPILRYTERGGAEADSLARFLLEIPLFEAAPERLPRFIEELEQSLLNDLLAQHRQGGATPSLQDEGYDRLEGALMDGHPYHPSYKSRIGFDYLDNLDYGPEFDSRLRPVWLAVNRRWSRRTVSASIEPDAFLGGELAEGYARFRDQIRQKGADPAAYFFLPVHPWQWRTVILPRFLAELQAERIILLGQAEDLYAPQQSIRTLANVSHPARAYLKLSLSIVNSSTARVLAPHTVQNAPPISDWLAGIVREDPYLARELRPIILREVLGVSYNPPQPAARQAATYGALSCIWRESLHRYLEGGEQALPFNGLCHLDGRGRPLIEPWIQKHGLEPWVRRLLAVAIPPVIHLLYAHGIGLEAHAQNMILLHREGWPQRLALKDFHDGVRFSRAHLADPDACPPLQPTPASHARVNRNSYLESDDPQEVRDFVHDAFFFINLAEVALLLEEHFDLEEVRFWSLAWETIASYEARFAHLQPRFACFDLAAPTIRVEQLTRRRLCHETELWVHPVRNVFAGRRQQGREG